MTRALVTAILFVFVSFSATFAAPISWTDWTSADGTSATGTLNVDGTAVSVDYSGLLAFSQLGTGTNYWTEGTPAPYTGNTVVDNAPTASEMLALNYGATNTITFSEKLINPLMAIVSMGQPNYMVSYDFDAPFTVLSVGEGYWNVLTGQPSLYTLSAGDVLNGYELHGVIQFNGTFSSISWTNSPNEYWHGFTFGVATETVNAPVPEPSTILLLGGGLLGLGWYGRKRKQA